MFLHDILNYLLTEKFYMPQTLKKAHLFDRGGRNLTMSFIMFYILMHASSIELKQAVSQRFAMQHIACPYLQSKVYAHIQAILYEQHDCYLPISNRIQMCQTQQEYWKQRMLKYSSPAHRKGGKWSTEVTEQCSVEQHDVSALNGE